MAGKTQTRRRGADMAQSLLWSMFTLIVIIGVLMMYSLVDLRKSKNDITTLISSVTTEIRAMGIGQADFSWLSDAYLINAGSVPTKYVRTNGASTTIAVPHGGSLTFSPGATSQTFNADITWDAGGNTPESLCMHLASVTSGRIASGTLGEEYEVISSSCSTNQPQLSVTYHR